MCSRGGETEEKISKADGRSAKERGKQTNKNIKIPFLYFMGVNIMLENNLTSMYLEGMNFFAKEISLCKWLVLKKLRCFIRYSFTGDSTKYVLSLFYIKCTIET